MSSISQRDLGQGFASRFEVLPATNPKTLEAVYGIRHEVYCEDLGYEPLRTTRQESDAHDSHSIHCLMRTADALKTPVGCVRLILTNPTQPDSPLPAETACAENLSSFLVDPRTLPRERLAEVSRLAVRRDFRRRRGEEKKPASLEPRDFAHFGEVIRFPFIPMGLYLCAMAECLRNGIEYVLVLTEPRLADNIQRLGFALRNVGPAVEHHGARIPSIIDVQGSVKGIRPLIRPMWEIVREQIEQGHSAPATGRRTIPLAQ